MNLGPEAPGLGRLYGQEVVSVLAAGGGFAFPDRGATAEARALSYSNRLKYRMIEIKDGNNDFL